MMREAVHIMIIIQGNKFYTLPGSAYQLPEFNSMKPHIMTPFKYGEAITWNRIKGFLITNVERVVTYKEVPFNTGDSGEGAAEFALNILTILFPPEEDFILCKTGRTSRKAFRLHQSFKFEFLAEAGTTRGTIPWSRIAKWIKNHETI